MRNLVIIPSYNEKENIASIIQAVLELKHFNILVVDDNSPDGTADIVRKLQLTTGKIHLLNRAGKLGLGTAYIEGFKYGIQHGFDHIIEMDADFSHDPRDLPRLVKACEEGADLVIGSRYVERGGFLNWPKSRIFISRGGSLYVRLLTGMPVMDPTAGFVCYRASFLRSFNLNKIKLAGYAFQIEMKYVAWKSGFKLQEIPIIFRDRELGQSKMNISIITEAISGVLKLVFRPVRKYYEVQQHEN